MLNKLKVHHKNISTETDPLLDKKMQNLLNLLLIINPNFDIDELLDRKHKLI
ncbi:hypothetical protein [Terrilactibacillus laevilacticus]|uniref:Uncharacterized protein n=1 Tax=Terrilactibacillus laevilacticus TaxID=1380157 RepID=A0ABW5PRS8_9BACI|nr:hypothetical protein [Terrilactibacillus laevilacticus]